jgi:cyanophycinase
MRCTLAHLLLFIVPLPSIAAQPAAPAELSGALLIVGGGELPDSVRNKFFELAGKAKAKIVVIPTASASAEERKASESFLNPWEKLNPLSVTLLHTRDRKQADDPDFVKPLTEATAVWFSGGDQKRLFDAYRGTLVEKELNNLFQRGKLIGGTSAGSAVMSEIMIESGDPKAKTGPGFGWLSGFVIDQHFTQRERSDRLQRVVNSNPGFVGLGIDESTAVVIRGRHLQIIGEGSVSMVFSASKLKPSKTDKLKSGALADLYALRRAALARAGEAFPPSRPADPIVPKGALVIGGGGGLPNDVLKRFIDLAGGVDSLIVVVTSAYDDPVPTNPAEVRLLRNVGANNVKTLHTRDPKESNKADFLKDLKEAKGVWFSGGRQWRFVDSYEGTEAEKLFRDVLARGGVIGGSSAGASIQSEYMPRGHPLGNLEMMAEGYERGFGYLPGVAVDQHFFARKRTPDMTKLVAAYPQLLGIGIDEGTAIVVQGPVMEVMGKSKVGVYDRRKPVQPNEPDYEELPTGTKYDLVKRQRLEN